MEEDAGERRHLAAGERRGELKGGGRAGHDGEDEQQDKQWLLIHSAKMIERALREHWKSWWLC